ncbi:MAG: transcription termination/antitermination protein NusA [Campylobacterales bacterium]|nr:transcription termination/antitermination protein NusA [Campylobacterales bacterium]
MEKILDTVEAIAIEKGITKEQAIDAFKEALVQSAKRLTSRDATFEARIDKDTKNYSLLKVITVVEEDDPRLDDEPASYMSLSEAKEIDEEIELGDQLKSEFILENYGRTASANLFKELEYHIQRTIEQNILDRYKELVGTIVIGVVTRVDNDDNTYVEIGELSGILSLRNRIKGEKFKAGDTIKALLRYVSIDPKFGLSLELSRTSPKFLEELLKKEVPEIEDESVEVVSCARIPGERAKIALTTNQANIDPIGATVGVKGVRINAVSDELIGENIDCIEYSIIPEIFITRALSPAIVQHVKVEDKKATVSITQDQKAKAIGRSGINIRLASMLTGYAIELEEVEGRVSGFEEQRDVQKTRDTTALEDLFR